MADEMPSLQIDTDWKKQAQAEKKRLAEEAEAAKSLAATSPAAGVTAAVPGSAASPAAAGRSAARGGAREMPAASFSTLVQSLLTQTLYYLGELGAAGGEPAMNLDLAKHQIDLMGVIDEKTRGNLSGDEQKLIDTALYEARMRFVSISSQML